MTLLVFQLVFGRHNIRPPHFASKVSYSASPQTFAECSRYGSVRAESPASPSPGATPRVPCSPFLRPVRAKVKVNRLPILLPLQGVGVYTLIPRALPWAEDWLPFQGARGEGCGARCP